MELSALRRLSLVTTTEMLVSDDPCAMAIILILLRPSALQSWPAVPVFCFMLSPTMAIIDNSFWATIADNAPCVFSRANSRLKQFYRIVGIFRLDTHRNGTARRGLRDKQRAYIIGSQSRKNTTIDTRNIQ